MGNVSSMVQAEGIPGGLTKSSRPGKIDIQYLLLDCGLRKTLAKSSLHDTYFISDLISYYFFLWENATEMTLKYDFDLHLNIQRVYCPRAQGL